MNYTKLNAITTADVYPMPWVEFLDNLAAAHYPTILDLRRRYLKKFLGPETWEKFAFFTLFIFYEFTIMPFGMKVMPNTFQRVANDLLEGWNYLHLPV